MPSRLSGKGPDEDASDSGYKEVRRESKTRCKFGTEHVVRRVASSGVPEETYLRIFDNTLYKI